MIKILFIAYYFPPLGGSGVQRSLKFVKYLPQYGFDPIVLTVKPLYVKAPKDHGLLSELPVLTKIYRTLTIDPNWLYKALYGMKLFSLVKWLQHNIFIPDNEILWIPFAKRRIKRILKATSDIRLVYISAGPFSSLQLGEMIYNQYKLPYVCDFRDEWTNNPTRLDESYPENIRNIELNLEHKVLSQAAGLTYINASMKSNFEYKYPFLIDKPNRVITNGFDEDDFDISSKSLMCSKGDKLVIVYTGSFYDRRKPELIWQAIDNLIVKRLIDPDKISVEIYGKNTPAFVLGDYFNNPIMTSIVRFNSYLSHKDVIKVITRAELLFLFIAPGQNSQAELTGKIFEYLRSGTPILAIIPKNGEAAGIIEKTNTGYIADSADLEQVESVILNCYDLWQNNTLQIKPNYSMISDYDRKKLTSDLAELLNEVLMK